MEIVDQFKERLSIKNFYDVIRIVDPAKKLITIVADNKMNERLREDINNSQISNMPLSIIMTDIDFLKKVNHKYGYVIGDKILIGFSDLILKSMRNNADWVGRFGVEEFIVVLNNTGLKDAYSVAETIRKKLENTIFNYAGISINITASFGVYNIKSSDADSLDLLGQVEKNLYKAKTSGGNRTIINQDNINGIKTENIKEKAIKLSGLNKHINEIREILNEVCCNVDTSETVDGRLIVSEYLDELIVAYMKELNDLK
ncbi:GGDEF domain-containing protein [Clostridium thailandense]|uniref:GGDEF domain-containing protein n=1 Tax=Clostridium thailandense TaxID=2794346 RepID=UPI003989B49A